MSLPHFCIKNPVFTIVINLVIIMVGIIAFQRLSVSGYPNIENPTIGIHTTLTGASADYMQDQVSRPIENAVSTITGIDTIESNSQQGVSDVVLTFENGVNLNVKMNEISNAISQISGQLPDNISSPEIHQDNPNSSPIISLFFYDDHRSRAALSDYLSRYVEPRIEKIQGVGTISLPGSRDYAVRIWLDPAKMAALHVDVDDVIDALNEQNVQGESGKLRTPQRDYPLVPDARVKRVIDFNNLIIRPYQHSEEGSNTTTASSSETTTTTTTSTTSNDSGGVGDQTQQAPQAVLFKDIATISLGTDDNETGAFLNGHPGVALSIVTTSDANPLEVAKHIHQELNQIQASLPQGMHVKIGYDFTTFLKGSIDSVYETLVIAIILILIVILVFLGSIRTSLIPMVTVPICLIGTMACIYFVGFSLNIISLLALVLAIGLVVDDAIVMVENIARHIEEGMSPLQAAFKGSNEVLFAILAMTLTLAAVYAPIGFSEGFTGQLFWQFAFTLTMAVIISGVVAVTLSPMMCAYLLPPKQESRGWIKWCDESFEKLIHGYQNWLATVLKHRISVVTILILLLVGSYLILKTLPSMLAPTADQGTITLPIEGPSNASYSYMKQMAMTIDKILAKVKQGDQRLITLGEPIVSRGHANLILKSWDKRKASQEEISNQLNQQLSQIPGVKTFAASPPPLGISGQGDFDIELVLMGADGYRPLNQVAQKLIKALSTYPGLRNLKTNLTWDKLQYDIEVNRDIAADLGIPVSDITTAFSTMLGSYTIDDGYYYQGNNYDIILRGSMPYKSLEDQLENIYVRTSSDQMVPISTLVTIKQSTQPLVLSHYNRMYAEHIMARLAPGYSTGAVVAHINQVAKQVLPGSVQYRWFGQTRNYLESQGSMLQNFILALIFIYLIMSAQFGSFIQPIIILLSVPASIFGALLTLKLTGNSINIFSNIGIITLIGLITKHGILITSFANQLRQEGVPMHEAVIKAAGMRLRPITMTTAAMVLGALPLVMHGGPGAESRAQIGWVIAGGLTFGTICTIFIVPVIYTLLTRQQQDVK